MSNPVAVIRHEVEYKTDEPLGDSIWLWCPGCDSAVRLPVNRASGTSWDFDGNIEAPTLSPSILQPAAGNTPRCHSYLKAGVWQFLADCEHDRAGEFVPMVPLPDWLVE